MNNDFETVPVGTMEILEKLRSELDRCAILCEIQKINIAKYGDTKLKQGIDNDLTELSCLDKSLLSNLKQSIDGDGQENSQ